MSLLRVGKIFFVGFVMAGILGCHEKPAGSAQSHNHVAAKTAKPGAAVKLISDSIIFINANELVNTELLLEVNEASGILNLELLATDGLNVQDTQKLQNIHFSSSTPIKIPVKLSATLNGRYYLNMHVDIDNGESLSTRNLALIVQVGAEKESPVQFKKTSGDNVISLPAQETISNQ